MKSYYSALTGRWQGRHWCLEYNFKRCVVGFQWSSWTPALYLGPFILSYDVNPD